MNMFDSLLLISCLQSTTNMFVFVFDKHVNLLQAPFQLPQIWLCPHAHCITSPSDTFV